MIFAAWAASVIVRSIMAASLSRPRDWKEIHSFKASKRRVVSREVVTRFGIPESSWSSGLR